MPTKLPVKKAPSTTKSAQAVGPRKGQARPRLTYLVGSLDRILRRKMTEALAPVGLTLAQFTALSVLDARGQASNAQLAERSFITPQSANEVMSAMSAKNWITREPDPNHGRIVVLRLTEEGRGVLRQGMNVVRSLEVEMVKDIQPGDAALVQNCLELFARNLRS
ncbi:MarR family winged helix-turn-helix transcriptional regulator [Caballeronia sp. GaOx3]|uniref:MarR family winged helix-turn-helix transcriptional regulator n=1 Tax=Caballeronia sp. GaOx3 TaxID=2921740 RepID=UPI00202926CC|nr:MarR family winged helix-turn-helix transcriptional regulator [Caballeronia sp. GaOx3]